MIYLLFFLFLKVLPPKRIHKIRLKDSTSCDSINGDNFVDNSYDHFFIQCQTTDSTLTINNAHFTRITTNSGENMINTINAALTVQESVFEDNLFFTSMLYCKDADFSLFSNTISNCYIPNYSTGENKAVIYDYTGQNLAKFQSNTITFSDTEHSCRAYYFFANTNVIWKYDTITNAKVPTTEQGSCGYFYARYGGNQPLEFNGCTFSNCYGGTYSVIYIDNLNDNYNKPIGYSPLKITNTTFKNIKNNKNYPENSKPAYLIYGNYQTNANNGEVYIFNCTFKFIESDVVMGCTFGSSKNFQITYDNTIFDGIYFSGERNGGVLVFDEVNDKKITVKNCLFKNISSKNGGCAIYYSTNTKDLTVENTYFIQCFTTGTGSTFGAIFINYQSNTSPAVIRGCTFDNIRASRGSAIYISQNDGNHQCTIEDCYFSDSGSSGFVIESSIKQLTINNASISFPENGNNGQCGGILINGIGVIEISSCKFDQIKGERSIYYKPNDYGFNDINSFTINDCTFDHCDGECIYIDVMSDSLEVVTIRQCSFICVRNKNGGHTSNTIGFNQYSRSLDLHFDSNYFFNCGKDGYIITFDFDYVNELTKTIIEFNDNEFKFDGTDGGCIALQILSKERPVLINNCTFNSCTTLYNGGFPWANTLSANYLPNIIIEKCQFIDGGRGINGNVIALQSEIQEATVQNCSFYSQKNDICSAAISIYTNFISIIGNSFERCGGNTIRYQCQENKDNKFELIENHFLHLSDGTILEDASTMQISPIIEGNIFENIKINSNSFNLKIQESSKTILFENNTFRNFKTSHGGFGGKIECNSNSIVHLTFNKCYFLDNHQDNYGGGFASSSDYHNLFVYLTFNECIFKNNEAGKYGGALTIQTKEECTIENCEFISNSVRNTENTQIYENGGGIYISNPKTTISGCKFSNNHCFSGSAIGVTGTTQLIINQNTEFYSNYNQNLNKEQFIISAENQKIDIIDAKFNCENDIHSNHGCIDFKQSGSISITRTKFQYFTSNSIICYKMETQSSNTNFLKIEECLFEHCTGRSLNLDVKENSEETITISNTIFQDCKKNNEDNQPSNTIYLNQAGSLIKLKINDNQFINCGTGKYVIFLQLNEAQNSEPIEFNNDEFKFDPSVKGCIALRILQPGREVHINNCTFRLCVQIQLDPWENTLSANQLSKIMIEKCKFIDGGNGNDGNVIVLQSEIQEATVQNCSFYSQKNDICSAAISIYTNFISIIGNSFERCGKNTIRYQCQENKDNKFELIENHFLHLSDGTILEDASTMQISPIIEGNIFENININNFNSFNLKIQESSKTILFENNTFRNFKTSHGGFGGSFNYELASSFHLTFNKCYFLDNHQDTNGGGFKGHSNMKTENVYYKFYKCFFDNNKASNLGGAILIENCIDCTIESCEFTSNSLKDNNGKGGAILFNSGNKATISGCKFSNNHCFAGNAIYIKVDCALFLINENTEFYSNYNPNINDQQFMIFSECNQIDFADSKFNCENNNHPNQGCIHFTRLSSISFTRVKFQYLSSNSIILYQPDLDEADNEFIIDECQFEHCRGKSLNFNVKEKSIEKITISKTIFQDCKDNTNSHTTNTIYINQVGSMISLKVNDNQFINCGTQGYIIFLDLNGAQNLEAIEFNNNEFKFDGTDGGCVALRILQPGRELYINNCTFFLCIKNGQEPWENTLSANHLSIIRIENSKFINCGHVDDGGNIIAIQGGVGRCEIYYSSFVSNDEMPCGAGLCSYCSNTILIGNTFENCVKNTVRFQDVVLNEFIFNYNHFMRCHIGSLVYFNEKSKLIQDPTFEGNTFENIKLTSNGNEEVIYAFLFRVQDSSKSILFENNTFKNFQTLQGGVGASFLYDANLPLYLTFNNCNFIDNHQNTEGGGFSSSNNYNSKNVYLTFRGCIFQNNQASNYGGALTIDTKQESSIEDCEFTSNSINSNTGKGGAISVRNDKSVSIKRCTFHNNNAVSGGGALYFYQTSNEIIDFIVSDCKFQSNKDTSNLGHGIYFEQITSDETKLIINENCLFTDNGDFDNRNHQGYTITSFAPILNFVNSRIEFTNVNKATAGLILDGSGSSFVNNVSFYHTNSHDVQDYDSMGIMICTSTNKVEINNCTFNCCGTNKNKKAIQNRGTNTIINDCQFLNEPGDSNVKTSAINIVNYGIHIITNCFAQFTSTNSGAFNYRPTSAPDLSQQSFTFENITIDDSKGDDRKSLSLELANANMLYLKNATFSNTYRQYTCIVGIIIPSSIAQLDLIEFNFINCTVADDNIGGIGLWIQVSNTHFSFINSLFEGNKAIHTDQKGNLGLGGALVIGRNWETSNLRMTIKGCNFTNNYANSNGGAILMSAQHAILIENCTFIGNSGENGGALYTEINNQVSEECKITNCTFDDNKVTSGQGSSLYLISASTRLCEITDCQFINNQEEKDLIYSKSGQLKIHDISFVLNNINQKIRPIYLHSSSNSVEIYNTHFSNCFFDGDGNAIKAERENNN